MKKTLLPLRLATRWQQHRLRVDTFRRKRRLLSGPLKTHWGLFWRHHVISFSVGEEPLADVIASLVVASGWSLYWRHHVVGFSVGEEPVADVIASLVVALRWSLYWRHHVVQFTKGCREYFKCHFLNGLAHYNRCTFGRLGRLHMFYLFKRNFCSLK